MLALMFAGEAVFSLPFLLPRLFKPTLLDVFGITNTQLGSAISIYGIIALICYALSGPLADLFAARNLMSVALLVTSLGGVALFLDPNATRLGWLYGFWGLSTTLLFWSALIRATRMWSTDQSTGLAFGLLDGGRGVIGGLIGLFAVFIFRQWLPDDINAATLAERSNALSVMIGLFTGMTVVGAIIVWFCVPKESKRIDDSINQQANEDSTQDQSQTSRPTDLDHEPSIPNDSETKGRFRLDLLLRALKMPFIWLQALILLCAYVGYRVLDDVSLYSEEVMQMDEADAALMGVVSLWARPVAVIAAGLIADFARTTTACIICFLLMIFSSATVAAGYVTPDSLTVFYLTFLTTSAAVYAMRGLYFSIMREGRIPLAVTGSAVGIVSVLGYTPEIFMGPLTGYFLDAYPQQLIGHQYVFGILTVSATVGLFAAIAYRICVNIMIRKTSQQ